MRSEGADGSRGNEGISGRKDDDKDGRQRVQDEYNLPAKIREQSVLLEHQSHH